MTTSDQIKVLCLRLGISQSELARKIGTTPQNFNAKLKRNSISEEDIKLITDILNIQYEHYFILKTGEVIK